MKDWLERGAINFRMSSGEWGCKSPPREARRGDRFFENIRDIRFSSILRRTARRDSHDGCYTTVKANAETVSLSTASQLDAPTLNTSLPPAAWFHDNIAKF